MGRIPGAAAEQVRELMGMSEEQADTVLQLICLPENGEPHWWRHYNYIERLGDGRGYTVTIFGACSGTGDLLMIFDELARIDPSHALLKYRPALRKCRGENVKGIEGLLRDIPALGEDEAWRTAVWRVYIDLYWKFAAEFAARQGTCSARPGPPLTTPLAKGFMVDTAINHGANLESFNKVVSRMAGPHVTDEAAWLEDFAKTRRKMLRQGFEQLDTSRTGDRCKLWLALLKDGNTTLQLPIRAANGYWGKGVVLGDALAPKTRGRSDSASPQTSRPRH